MLRITSANGRSVVIRIYHGSDKHVVVIDLKALGRIAAVDEERGIAWFTAQVVKTDKSGMGSNKVMDIIRHARAERSEEAEEVPEEEEREEESEEDGDLSDLPDTL